VNDFINFSPFSGRALFETPGMIQTAWSVNREYEIGLEVSHHRVLFVKEIHRQTANVLYCAEPCTLAAGSGVCGRKTPWQAAEKLASVLDFGWRSVSALR